MRSEGTVTKDSEIFKPELLGVSREIRRESILSGCRYMCRGDIGGGDFYDEWFVQRR